MTIAGLRRSDGVDDHSTSFRSHRGGHRGSHRSVFDRTGPGPRPGLVGEVRYCQLSGRDPDNTEFPAGEDGCGLGEQRDAKVCGMRVRDKQSGSVQDARHETPTSQMAVHLLRPQLCTPVCPLSTV